MGGNNKEQKLYINQQNVLTLHFVNKIVYLFQKNVPFRTKTNNICIIASSHAKTTSPPPMGGNRVIPIVKSNFHSQILQPTGLPKAHFAPHTALTSPSLVVSISIQTTTTRRDGVAHVKIHRQDRDTHIWRFLVAVAIVRVNISHKSTAKGTARSPVSIRFSCHWRLDEAGLSDDLLANTPPWEY